MNSDLRAIYDDFSETYDAHRGLFDMSGILHPFFASLGPAPGALLDLGCGAGEPFPRFFLDRAWSVTGVDFSPKMLALAARYAPNMTPLCADMLDVDFPPSRFDALTCIYSLFHVPRARHPELFAKFFRWLRPGGRALFTYASRAYTGADAFEGEMDFMGRRLFYSHWTPDTLRAQLADAGLAVESAPLRDIGGESFLWVTARKPLPIPTARPGAPDPDIVL